MSKFVPLKEFSKTNTSNAERDIKLLQDFMEKNPDARPGHVASHLNLKYTNNPLFKEYVKRHSDMVVRESGQIETHPELDRWILEKKITPLGMDNFLTLAKEYQCGVYTPIEILTEFANAGVFITNVLVEGVPFYKLHYRSRSHSEPQSNQFPVGTKDLASFAKFVFSNSNLKVLKYDDMAFRCTAMIVCTSMLTFAPGEKLKVFAMKPVDEYVKMMGEQTGLFDASGWNEGIREMVAFLTQEGADNMQVIRKIGTNVTASMIYKSVFKTLSDKECRKLAIDRVEGLLLGKLSVTADTLKTFYMRGLIGGVEYLRKRRGLHGEDKKLGSQLTRNIHIGAALPDSHSTVLKWRDVVKKIPEKGDYTKIYVAGCSPGHFLPLMHNHLLKYIKYSDDVDELNQETEKRSNISYIDIAKCSRPDKYKWSIGNVHQLVLGERTLLISDCWPDNDDVDFTRRMMKALMGYMNGRTYAEIDYVKSENTGALTDYAVKILMEYGTANVRDASRGNAPQFLVNFINKISEFNAYRTKKGMQLFDYPYLTKFGREHNTEFLLSSFKISDATVHVTGIIELGKFCDEFGKQMVITNLRRVYYPVSVEEYPDIKAEGLEFEDNPVVVRSKRDMSLAPKELEDIVQTITGGGKLAKWKVTMDDDEDETVVKEQKVLHEKKEAVMKMMKPKVEEPEPEDA